MNEIRVKDVDSERDKHTDVCMEWIKNKQKI